MSKLTFILGGARSGKSRQAVSLAREISNSVVFVATAVACDEEMQLRINKHKVERPITWQVFEEPVDILPIFERIQPYVSVVILDCLTIFIANLLLGGAREELVESIILKLIPLIKKSNFETIIVANEVGLGIVPNNFLSRNFRDVAGKVNQTVAKNADRVLFMISGLPMIVKE